jgi:predicted GTPase
MADVLIYRLMIFLQTVSHVHAGVSDIDTEISSDTNQQFVLHDSKGLEPGETENFNTVLKFMEKRSKMPQIKDKLHAIW